MAFVSWIVLALISLMYLTISRSHKKLNTYELCQDLVDEYIKILYQDQFDDEKKTLNKNSTNQYAEFNNLERGITDWFSINHYRIFYLSLDYCMNMKKKETVRFRNKIYRCLLGFQNSCESLLNEPMSLQINYMIKNEVVKRPDRYEKSNLDQNEIKKDTAGNESFSSSHKYSEEFKKSSTDFKLSSNDETKNIYVRPASYNTGRKFQYPYDSREFMREMKEESDNRIEEEHQKSKEKNSKQKRAINFNFDIELNFNH